MSCDLLLINPRDKETGFRDIPPLGTLWIAAVLERERFKVRVVDLTVDKVDYMKLLQDENPPLVGIGGTSHSRFEAFGIAADIKKVNPNVKIVYGGVHATFTAEDTLRHIADIDFVIRGEGEQTLLELMKALSEAPDVSKILGISYRRDGKIFHNPNRRFLPDLDELPLPARHLANMNAYDMKLDHVKEKGTAIITSRGCPYNCNFCSASAMFGHTIRTRSASKVLDEIESLLVGYKLQGIKIFDSTFTAVRGHAEEICQEILDRGLKFPWECEVRVDTIDEELLSLMKTAGCYYVNIGIESASQRVLNSMNKRITVEMAQNALGLCYRLGILTKVFFSFGHIGEDLEDVDKTFKFIELNKKKITTLAWGAGVRIYPGTPLERYARENGYLPRDFSWPLPYEDKRWELMGQSPFVPILTTKSLTVDDLIGIRHRIVKEKLRGWKGLRKGFVSLFQPEQWKKGSAIIRGMLKHIL
ncbi:MAG: hypothetical protein AMJ46_10805 [Latescibacteria bacterium DG_63]|nr:MAG: hypothetical protein AMJ46_10805 [Latescibacteria bacterium DG_63]